MMDIEDLSNNATVNFCDVYWGLVYITKQHKTEMTDIEAMYIEDCKKENIKAV